MLAPGSVVTTPRFCIDYVVTEYGIARLRGKSLWARAEALTAIAHPKFRDELANSIK
jgi:acyl-CoA hydrolase